VTLILTEIDTLREHSGLLSWEGGEPAIQSLLEWPEVELGCGFSLTGEEEEMTIVLEEAVLHSVICSRLFILQSALNKYLFARMNKTKWK